jgi:SAM-dependent methyltransferase
MKLSDLLERKPFPEPWQEGDNIPWNDPDFSQRMLQEHLSQEHDAASRRFERIDRQVTWIHEGVLKGRASRVLDLGCGPGLYTRRLARLGHHCLGIDFSPASIGYARKITEEEGLDCTFHEADIREANYGEGYDAVMLIYGELNVFRPTHAALILDKVHKALKPGGHLLLEPHTFEAVRDWGCKARSWYSSDDGLFSSEPHLVLEEYFWDPDNHITTNRYYVIHVSTRNVIRYAQSVQAYTLQEYEALLANCGYSNFKFYPSLVGEPDPEQVDLLAILAAKPK